MIIDERNAVKGMKFSQTFKVTFWIMILFLTPPLTVRDFFFLVYNALTMPGVGFLFLFTKVYNTSNGKFSTHPVLSSQTIHLINFSLKKTLGSMNVTVKN